MLKTAPAVFAVDREYQVIVPLNRIGMVWVQVGDEYYYDATNGIMNSLDNYHRVIVPAEKLDAAREYTLFVRPIIERKPYFSTTEEPISYHYKFNSVPKDNIRIFHIADAHGRIEEPVEAARRFGHIDLLILNGDILDHSGDPSKFLNVYEICAKICQGSHPAVFSRGNHDLRGTYAEKLADYTPNRNGLVYYSFRVGSIWGLVLDCGEDKADDHPEYGFTVACHQFRKKQCDYIDHIVENCDEEYLAEGVEHRVVVSHVPFTYIDKDPFDIEQDIYSYWTEKLSKKIKPDLIICGHMHSLDVVMPGDPWDSYGQPCPVVIGSCPTNEGFIASAVVLHQDSTEVHFVDNYGKTDKFEITKTGDQWIKKAMK